MTSEIIAVPFHGDELVAARNENGVWVAVKRVCEALDIDHSDQLRVLKSKAWATMGVITMVGADGKNRSQQCIHVDKLPMWLATIDATRVKDSSRAKLERYQCEAADVLRDHFLRRDERDSTSDQLHQELISLSLRMKAMEERRESIWDLDLKLELARLRRIAWDGRGREPQTMAHPYGVVWRIILGDTVYDELKRRNPHPRDGSLHYAWLQDRRYELVKESDMAVTLAFARRSGTWREFVSDMQTAFRRADVQFRLQFPTPVRRLRA